MLDWLSNDGKLIFVAKSARTLSYGFIGVIFTVYLSQLGLSPTMIGFSVTLTLLFTALSTIFMGFMANRLGRKRSLLALAVMLFLSAILLIVLQNPIGVVTAAIIGNVSVSAGETGPFLSVEQAILPTCCTDRRRNSLFSLYNLIGYGALSVGSLLAGLPAFFEASMGKIGSYQPLFFVYVLAAFASIVAYSRMSAMIERGEETKLTVMKSSARSRSIITRLALLFALDSFGGGFIVQSILSYWFYTRYGATLPQLGAIFFGTQVVTAISFIAAARIAGKIGLINTMVFTHLPSNLLLITLAFAPNLPIAAILLLARHTLSQMDVPTRQSYIVAVVDETARDEAAGLTNASRTVGQAISPSITGYIIQYVSGGLPFILSGALKIVYDILLYFNFRRIKPPEEISSAADKD